MYTVCSLAARTAADRVVIPLCGGNIDTTVLGRCLERGLAADGRLCRFVATVSDRAGGIAELTNRIASIGVWSVLASVLILLCISVMCPAP